MNILRFDSIYLILDIDQNLVRTQQVSFFQTFFPFCSWNGQKNVFFITYMLVIHWLGSIYHTLATLLLAHSTECIDLRNPRPAHLHKCSIYLRLKLTAGLTLTHLLSRLLFCGLQLGQDLNCPCCNIKDTKTTPSPEKMVLIPSFDTSVSPFQWTCDSGHIQ